MESPEIFIRPLRVEDVSDQYVAWLNDPEVNQYLETKYQEQTRETVLEFVQSKVNSQSEFLMAICLRQSSRHIGNIKLGPVNPHHLTADVSLFIGEKDSWGKGYATQAIYLISKFGFDEKRLQKLKAGCYETNTGSARAFEKCGYKREGTLRSAILHKGVRIDAWQYGLLPTELRQPWRS